MKTDSRFRSYLIQFFLSEKCFRQASWREWKHTFYFQWPFIFFENRAVYEIMWKTIVDLGRPHDDMTHAHCIPKVTNTLKECNTCCSSTTTTVTRTILNITLYVHCLSCYNKMGCVYCAVWIGYSKSYRSRSPWFYSVLQQRLRWYPKSMLLCMLLMPPPPLQIIVLVFL